MFPFRNSISLPHWGKLYIPPSPFQNPAWWSPNLWLSIPKQLILKAGQTTLTTPSLYVIGNQWELCHQIWSCESFALLRGLVWSLWDVYLSVSARVSRTMLVVGVCKYQKWVKACQIATKDMESEYVTNYWYRTGTVRAYSNLMVSSARIN